MNKPTSEQIAALAAYDANQQAIKELRAALESISNFPMDYRGDVILRITGIARATLAKAKGEV